MLNKSRIERRESISFNSMAVDEYEQHRTIYTVKLMLLGAKSVGKSRMLESYTHEKKPIYQQEPESVTLNRSENVYHTEGIDFVSKIEQDGNMEYHLHIWDTADFNQFVKNRTFFESLSNNVLGFLIVYDITRKQTYELTNAIYNVIRGDLKREVYLVGTNLDQAEKGKRQVSYETALNYAASRNMTVHQIDASNYKQVQELFRELLFKIVKKKGFQGRTGPKLSSLGSDGFQKRYNRCC